MTKFINYSIVLFFCLGLSFQGLVAQKNEDVAMTTVAEKSDLAMTTVELDRTVIEFGEIVQGEKVYETFQLTNTGDAPLIISNIKASCGCTVPQWTKAPIMFGESTEIELVFSSKGKSGTQNKAVTITGNFGDPIRLFLKGNVTVPEK